MDRPAVDIICTADGRIIPVQQVADQMTPVAPDLGYGLALLCALGGLVVAFFNLVLGRERRGFQAIVIQLGAAIWFLVMGEFLMKVVNLGDELSVILLFGTTLAFPLPALWVLRRVPWPAPPSPASLAMETNVPKRGGCLTAFLMFALTISPLIGLSYLLIASEIQRLLPSVPGWVVPVYSFVAIADFVFALAIWKWKKWGVYGYAATYIIVIIINLSVGLPIYGALLGLAGLAIFVSLIRPVWAHLK